MSARVFPLHLTPLETFMLADDRPRYPMTFTIHVDLLGQMNRPAFERALAEGLERHPLLQSLIAQKKLGKLCWVESHDVKPPIDWADASEPVKLAGPEHIDLYSEPGLRLWVRQGDEAVRVTAQFHHTATDGIGAYRFLGDVLAVYGRLTADKNEQTPTLEPIDLARLRGRADGAMSPELATRPFLMRAWRTAKFFVPYRTQTCQMLAAPRGEQAEQLRAFPGVDSYIFTADEMKQLRGAAADIGLTVNDMLASDLFLAIADWNKRIANRPSRRCYRIMIPFDLRAPEDYATPATNLAAYTFLKRFPKQLDNEERLLASVRDDTARIKHYRLGTVFADMNYSLERAPAIRRWLLDLNLCTATAVLSNVGDPARRFTARFPRKKGSVVCGNLVLEGISGAPPIRRHTRVAISLFSYRRELTMSVRTDPYLFTDEENREFLAAYVQQIARRLDARPRNLEGSFPRVITAASDAEIQHPTASPLPKSATLEKYAVTITVNGRQSHRHGSPIVP